MIRDFEGDSEDRAFCVYNKKGCGTVSIDRVPMSLIDLKRHTQ